MARTVLTAVTLAPDTVVVATDGVALVIADDMEVPVAITSLMDRMNLFIRAELSAATAADTMTIKAGDGLRSGLGDLVYTCGGGAVKILFGPLESERFKIKNASVANDRGKMHIDFAGATIAGKIFAYLIPK
jgi:hypothetical protein